MAVNKVREVYRNCSAWCSVFFAIPLGIECVAIYRRVLQYFVRFVKNNVIKYKKNNIKKSPTFRKK